MKSLIQGEVNRTLHSLRKHLTSLTDAKQLKIKSNAIARISNDINKIYSWFFGDVDKAPNEQNTRKTIDKIVDCETGLFLALIENLQNLEFDASKKASQILKYIIKNCKINKCHHYIKLLTNINNHNPIIQSLINQYNRNCSEILHEMVKRPELTSMFLNSVNVHYKMTERETNVLGIVDVLMILMQNPDLVISSASFKTLRCLLTSDNKYVSIYLDKCFNHFFDEINKIITYDNCVLQKRLLVLLHDIITMENHYNILMKYIQNTKYLLLSMNLMNKYSNKSISFEAWHIFKLFVANKHKQKDIHFILWKNKDNLIHFLSSSYPNKGNDGVFETERQSIIKTLQKYSDSN